MSPSVIAYIFVSQIVSSPAIASISTTFVYSAEKHPIVHTKLRLIGDLVSNLYNGFWNLDFFRFVYQPFYLHPNMTTLQVISLDHAIAVYPLLLILLTMHLSEFTIDSQYSSCLVVCMYF